MKYKLADQVSVRLVQIFQEAIIMGVDGADLLRQVRVIVDATDPETLVLDPEYAQQVEVNYKRLIEEVNANQKEEDKQKLFT